MTYNPDSGTKMPFGVMRVMGDSFSLLFRNFILLMGLALLMQIILFAVNYILTGSGNGGFSNSANLFAFQQNGPLFILIGVISIIGYSFSTAMISLAAFDLKTNTPVSIPRYISTALKSIFPLTILSILIVIISAAPVLLATLLGAIATPLLLIVAVPLAIVAVLYVFSIFSMVTPAIVIEGEGFRALGRSMDLTREYRRSIIGLYAIILFGMIILMMIVGAIVGVMLFGNFLNIGGVSTFVTLGSQLFNLILTSLISAFFSVVIVMAFARLKEIKEGYGFENVGDVFD